MVEYKGIKFVEHGDKLTVDIINSLGFCAKLPKDYMDFLIMVNGGVANKNVFNVSRPGYNNTICIDRFLGVTSKSGCNILLYKDSYKEYGGTVPDYMLQIAVSESGDPIFIALKLNDKRGRIYYWDHDYAFHSDESFNPDTPILIANSFEEFINMLHESSDE